MLALAILTACTAAQGEIKRPIVREETKTPFFPELEEINHESNQEEEVVTEMPIEQWWISASLPREARKQIEIPDQAEEISAEKEASVRIAIGKGEIIGHWVYAAVVPFSSLTDEIKFSDLQRAWDGRSVAGLEGGGLMMSAETEAVFSAYWGDAAKDAVEIVPDAQLLERAWLAVSSWAIVPFEELAARWKVLSIDSQSPIWKDFEAEDYPLAVPIGIAAEGKIPQLAGLSNREEEKMTTVITSGVTALVRATAWEIERKGIAHAQEEIGDLLREADIMHISNEVPFAENCPPPNPGQRTLIFCSDARYIELLELIGTDVVELTGDHFNDWTRDAMLYTLELYKERGWPYYGGGANLEEGLKALELEHNGNLIAFIGCNGKGGGYASAAEDYPGAVECDYEWLESEISRLSDAGYIVIATFQHDEVYTYKPQPGLIRDFQRVAMAGASIVSGSQAHQAHGVQFSDEDTLIMYGLGNLFFDQIVISQDTSQAIIARHVMYDGRYISSELFTTVFLDYAKSRFMTVEERAEYLAKIFKASIWEFAEAEGSEDGT